MTVRQANATADQRDLALQILADAEAELWERVDKLLDVIAHLAVERHVLLRVLEREMVTRIHAEGMVARYQQRLFPRKAAA